MKEHVILLITNRQEEDIIVRHIMSKEFYRNNLVL